MVNITALLSGLLFGIGLIVSGLANPQKVLSFLDIMGAWDVHLLWVLIGAIIVASVGFAWVDQLARQGMNLSMDLPVNSVVDKRLVIGSIIFGVGWGLAGICPAPALVLIGSGQVEGGIFVVAMLVGMHIFEIMRIN